MKNVIERISVNPKYSKLYSWGKLITITGSAQMVVQATGLAVGILIVRLLPTQEYAYYTLANTMLGAMTVLADGGISSGVMAYGGEVWKDKIKLGVVLSTGLKLRREFAIGSLLIAVPALIYLLYTHGANLITISLIVISLVPAFFAALSDSLLEIVPKLHQDIPSLQRNQLSVGIGRLLLSFAFLFIFPLSAMAIFANGIPRLYGNVKLRRITGKFIDTSQVADPAVSRKILKIVKRLLPTSIYYCLSGQISIWLISVFGNSTSLAQIGALSRLSVILSLFTVLFSTLIVPRFSRLPLQRKSLARFILLMQLIVIGFCISLMTIIYTYPSQLLFVLGKNYSNLSHELFLSIGGSCVSLLASLAFSLYISRGWAIHPLISIPVNIASIILASVIFNMQTLEGILLLNIFTSAVQYVMNLIFIFLKITQRKGHEPVL